MSMYDFKLSCLEEAAERRRKEAHELAVRSDKAIRELDTFDIDDCDLEACKEKVRELWHEYCDIEESLNDYTIASETLISFLKEENDALKKKFLLV